MIGIASLTVTLCVCMFIHTLMIFDHDLYAIVSICLIAIVLMSLHAMYYSVSSCIHTYDIDGTYGIAIPQCTML
jgi:hypothetical protein